MSYNHKIKAIDKNNNRLFTVFNYDNGADYVNEGLFRIVDDNSDLIGFGNNEGKVVIQPQFFYVLPFSDSIAAFNEGGKSVIDNSGEHSQIVGGKWGYIDNKGNILFPAIFDEAMSFRNDTAKVKIAGNYFTIHK